jgi:hypothetical protein
MSDFDARDLLNRARDANPAVARVAGYELGASFLGAGFIDDVVLLLDHEEPAVREGACRALGESEIY